MMRSTPGPTLSGTTKGGNGEWRRPIIWFMLVCLGESVSAAPNLTGETQLWHRITLTFDGPATSETAHSNPFLDYRLNVAFTHSSSGEGANSANFLTMNVDGDGRNVWPWINPWVCDRFNCSKPPENMQFPGDTWREMPPHDLGVESRRTKPCAQLLADAHRLQRSG